MFLNKEIFSWKTFIAGSVSRFGASGLSDGWTGNSWWSTEQLALALLTILIKLLLFLVSSAAHAVVSLWPMDCMHRLLSITNFHASPRMMGNRVLPQGPCSTTDVQTAPGLDDGCTLEQILALWAFHCHTNLSRQHTPMQLPINRNTQ